MVVSFSSIKGGTGKTSLCIHVANYCAAAGYKVLVIDFDIQNSLSFYYLDEISVADRKNLALALNSRDLVANILPSNCFGIDILASSFSLTNLRTIGANTLRRMIAESSQVTISSSSTALRPTTILCRTQSVPQTSY